MKVNRFMSAKEYEALMAGQPLHNETNHGAKGVKSTSIGFCFFTENPDKAIHWLSGLVTTDWLVEMEIPDEMLNESKGRYCDVDRDTGFGMPPMMWRKEYCLTDYQLSQVKILDTSDRYALYGRLPEGISMNEVFARLGAIGRMVNERRKKGKGGGVYFV